MRVIYDLLTIEVQTLNEKLQCCQVQRFSIVQHAVLYFPLCSHKAHCSAKGHCLEGAK